MNSQWRALETSVGAYLATVLLQQQGGWQHPWHATKTAAHWLIGVSWSAAVMCMWLSIGYAAYPFVLGALFGVYWLPDYAWLAGRICCCRRGWDAKASDAFTHAAMWLPQLPDDEQKVGRIDLVMHGCCHRQVDTGLASAAGSGCMQTDHA